MEKENIDLLGRIEELTAKINELFAERARSVFGRYPLTFALLVVFGVTMVTQGVKDLIIEIPFLKDQPFAMLAIGILVLIFTGTLYKKLNK